MFLDTSVLFALAAGPARDPIVVRLRETVGKGPFHISPIQMGELADAARKNGLDPDAVVRSAYGPRQVPLTADIAVEASAIKSQARRDPRRRDFSLIDGIVLASARAAGVELVSLDADFEGLPDCIVL